ncbi:MAG TPA: ribonuclease III [Gaiellaceae bacterium]|nr:ribonuclease III [Gaiellaceae bacterium]
MSSDADRGAGGHAALRNLIDALPEERAGHVFTHTSWAASRADSYERLEFLGDSVLGLAIARELYERFPDYPEGQLAKIRAHVVSRQSCAVVGRRLGLGAALVERGEDAIPADELERLAVNRNVLAALVEAALGALYLEHGFEPIRQAVLDAFGEQIDYALTSYVDYKTELQEELARRGLSVSYAVLDVEGPPHDRRFTCAAVIDGEQAGMGDGPSKKAAEQNAAREALETIRA